MEFSIVVPVYNEAGNIFPLLQEINRVVPRGSARIQQDFAAIRAKS